MRGLVFGTYDKLHKGHLFFLSEARNLCDELYLVLALDKTVENLKGKAPSIDVNTRKQNIELQNIVDKVVLGLDGSDHLKIVEQINPDIIILGYDQRSFTSELDNLSSRGLNPKIVRIEKSFFPEKYKSSKL